VSERLIPVTAIIEPGVYELSIRIEVDRDGYVGPDFDRSLPGASWWQENAFGIKHVEVEPDLPTWPGALIRCEVEGFGEQFATLKASSNLGGPGIWVIFGEVAYFTPDQITRVIEVIRPGTDPRPKPGPRPGPAVGR
jgi:hypothetical protein